MRPPATNGNKKRDELGDKMGDELGNKLGDKPGDKLGDKLGDKGNRETMGDKKRQDLGKADTPSTTGTHVGRKWETMGDKTSGRSTHRPSNTSTHVGRQWKTMGDKER